MVTDNFNSPTRAQIAKVAGNDERLIRAFEDLFRQAGRGLPDDIDDIVSDIGDLRIDAGTALSVAQSAMASAIRSAQRLRSNEVLTWLSM